MATYRPRPDGLVDVQLDSGQTLPMSEQQAQLGGATPEPPAALPGGLAAPPGPGSPASPIPPPAVPPGPLAPAPLGPPQLGPNPYSMIGSGQATADLAQATRAAMARAHDGQPAAPGAGIAPPPTAPDWATGKTFDQEAAANAPANERAEQAKKDQAAAEVGKLKPIASSASGEGGYQLDHPLSLTGATLPLESRVVRPGVRGEASYKRVMNDLNPEDVRDQHLEGAQNVYLAGEQAIESQRLANESTAIYNEDRKNELAERRATLQQKQNTIEQREREASQATPQSRQEIMGSRSSLSKMMGALSIAMGGYYQGLTGRNNPGLDLINQTIAQDIADQRAKWEAAKDKVGMANNDFAKAMQLYGDPNVAEADLYNRNLTLAANIAQNHWKRADNEGEYSKQKEVAQALLEQAAQKKQDAFTMLNGQIVQDTYKREPPQVQGVLSDDQRERQVHVPGYGYGFVTNKGAATAVQDQLTAAGNALDIFAELKSLQKDGKFVNDLNTRAKLKALKARALPAISAAEKQGVVTEADAKNAKDVLNDENALFTDGTAALDATELAMRLTLDGIVRDRVYSDPLARIPMKRQRAGSFTPGL